MGSDFTHFTMRQREEHYARKGRPTGRASGQGERKEHDMLSELTRIVERTGQPEGSMPNPESDRDRDHSKEAGVPHGPSSFEQGAKSPGARVPLDHDRRNDVYAESQVRPRGDHEEDDSFREHSREWNARGGYERPLGYPSGDEPMLNDGRSWIRWPLILCGIFLLCGAGVIFWNRLQNSAQEIPTVHPQAMNYKEDLPQDGTGQQTSKDPEIYTRGLNGQENVTFTGPGDMAPNLQRADPGSSKEFDSNGQSGQGQAHSGSAAMQSNPMQRGSLGQTGAIAETGDSVAFPPIDHEIAQAIGLPEAHDQTTVHDGVGDGSGQLGPEGGQSHGSAERSKPLESSEPSHRKSGGVAPGESGLHQVQLGYSLSQEGAHRAFRTIQRRYPQFLSDFKPDIIPAEVGGRMVYRIRVGRLSLHEAKVLCARIKALRGDCFVAKVGRTTN